MNNFIEKAVAEFRKKFTKMALYRGTKGRVLKYADMNADNLEAFLIQKLEHLAKQKDEEFLEMLKEKEIPTNFKRAFFSEEMQVIEHRSQLLAELRNKVQGGTGK